MATVTKAGTPSLATIQPGYNCYFGAGLYAGEAIAAFDACYIKSDGFVYRSTAAAANAAAEVHGFAAMPATAAGRPVDLLHDVNVQYATGLTPGKYYYLSPTTPGALDDTAPTNQTKAVAVAVDATRLRVKWTF